MRQALLISSNLRADSSDQFRIAMISLSTSFNATLYGQSTKIFVRIALGQKASLFFQA
jgi:hypothetical protein